MTSIFSSSLGVSSSLEMLRFLFLWLWVMMAKTTVVTAASNNKPPIFHSYQQPKLTLYKGDVVENIETHKEASEFCKSQGELVRLATHHEWCWYNQGKQNLPDIFGFPNGPLPYEQWVPVGWQDNQWLQIGTMVGEGSSDNLCKHWRDIEHIEGGPRDHAAVIQEGYQSHCVKPSGENCQDDDTQCTYDCSDEGFPAGYYPDPTNCKAYCYCSGRKDVPSWWQIVSEKDYIWNPYCRDSTALDKNNIPLGGMTGGCPTHSDYVDDQSYCKPEQQQKQRGRDLAAANNDGGPDWGRNGDLAKPFVDNYILCMVIQRPPPVPQTCGVAWGDPHLITFDGIQYDCHGSGEYILSKSLDSGLELQGRFLRAGSKDAGASAAGSSNYQATIATGATFTTGRPNEPTIEARYASYNACHMEYYIDGKRVNLDSLWARNGTISTGTEAVHYFPSGNDRFFYFPGSGISFHIHKKNSKKIGCYINIKLCLPDDIIATERFVGLMGTPNHNKADDFMDSQGNGLGYSQSLLWKDAYDYCTDHWCIRNKDESLFVDPIASAAYCDEPYDESLERKLTSDNLPSQLVSICGTNAACLLEGTVGDIVADSTDSVVEQKQIFGVETLEEIPSPTPDDPDVEDEDEVFENTDVKPAPPTANTERHVLEDDDDDSNNHIATATAMGDPHFEKWNGEKYDFHGGCDLVLIQNPDFSHGLGLDVHVRTKIDTWWSFIETAAVRIGENVLEITGGKEKIAYYLDGVNVEDLQTGDGSLGDFPIRFKRHSLFQSQTRIDLGSSNALSIETYKRFVRVNVKATHGDSFKGSFGMLGSFPGGDMIARDKVTMMKDPAEFGQEWMVLETEPKLLHSDSDVKPPMKCLMPDVAQKTEAARRRLGDAVITEADAALACARVAQHDFESCIFDVLATMDLDMAGSY